ncbi:hypothetical protein FOWG_16144 [Fusarium oxysporum f. sp. lycopersici MN25]|nr:hypothetical protein FOWG_16144 [Fusarium oxysporum f. sp. lycopersici MN25]KAJ0128287.1 Uncharacterized protein HZ326_28620 [Fusarium oxysporum f. sp. albedinis]RKK08690.1 hypothetical protein BFJ65_g16351 [Fusarium oxysporum f. sp. cepae]RKK31385.1 hypothetical protein BFJ66_g15864 [Fusarium oxysporum f. sp. cepae]RKK31702.1 hypothetical protein BFJ67_g15102 [Fusarium oxysporum f. sp. cepae]
MASISATELPKQLFINNAFVDSKSNKTVFFRILDRAVWSVVVFMSRRVSMMSSLRLIEMRWRLAQRSLVT